jgi:hypothetical protein
MSKQSTQTTVNQLDPTVAPYIQYGLGQAKTFYDNPQAYYPQYYQGQTYVSPSEQTSAALLALKNRATQGSALKPAATQEQLNTISGQYLYAGNPYLQSALGGGFQQATTAYNQAVNQALSSASQAGRYGSGAMNTALGAAGTTLANSLANQAGSLAYQNYAAERARQEAAAQMYPQMAQADYYDINQLYQAGQQAESYQQAALQDAINRWNYAEQMPQNALQQYMSYAYGAPMGSTSSTPIYRNYGGSILGGAATGAALGSAIPGVGTAIGAGLGGLLGLL